MVFHSVFLDNNFQLRFPQRVCSCSFVSKLKCCFWFPQRNLWWWCFLHLISDLKFDSRFPDYLVKAAFNGDDQPENASSSTSDEENSKKIRECFKLWIKKLFELFTIKCSDHLESKVSDFYLIFQSWERRTSFLNRYFFLCFPKRCNNDSSFFPLQLIYENLKRTF